MKKAICTLLCIAFVFTGCSGGKKAEARIEELESHIEVLESQLEEYRNRGAAQQAGESDGAPAGEDEQTAEAVASTMEGPGTRQNPVPRGEEITFDHAHIRGDMNATLRISQVIRGEDAVTYASGINSYNKAPDGKELLLFKVHFTLNSFSGSDGFLCSQTSFTYYETDNSQITAVPVIVGLEELNARLFEGGSTEGWLYTAVEPSDPSPHAVFDNTFWFALYPASNDNTGLTMDDDLGEEEDSHDADVPTADSQPSPDRDAESPASSQQEEESRSEGASSTAEPSVESSNSEDLLPDLGALLGSQAPT